MKIIFAQGNPSPEYEKTRHNTGFLTIDTYAGQHGVEWQAKDKFNAHIAELTINGEKILLVKPSSFYNETGSVARKLIDFYKADPATDLLVIHDDLSLPLGTIRIRQKGSDAGNNGIKSLNAHIGEDYARVRIGIWTEGRDRINDVDFVLGRFSKEESETLEKTIIPHALQCIDRFLTGTLEPNSHTP